MIRSAEETSLLIALLMKRANKDKAKINTFDIRHISRYANVRYSYILMIKNHLDDLGIILFDLDNDKGEYGLIRSSVLNKAHSLNPKSLKELKNKEINFAGIKEEIGAYTIDSMDEEPE